MKEKIWGKKIKCEQCNGAGEVIEEINPVKDNIIESFENWVNKTSKKYHPMATDDVVRIIRKYIATPR